MKIKSEVSANISPLLSFLCHNHHFVAAPKLMSYQQLRRQQQKISPLESDFPSSKIFGRSLVVLLHRPVTLPSLPLFLPPSPLLLFDIIILTVCGNMKKKKGGKSVGGGGGEERSRLGPKTYQVL